MPDIFATPGMHAEKFDQVSGGVIPYVTLTTPATAIPTTDSLGGTRAFNWENNVREAYGTTSTAAIQLPTLGASREMRVHTSSNAFIRFGGAGVAAATVGQGQMKSPSELPDVIRIPTGQTHCRVIGETASGSISLTAVI